MSASRQKGTSFETAVVRWLQDHGFPNVERRALRGKRDAGDIAGLPGWVLECKATKVIDLAGACDEARRESLLASAWPVENIVPPMWSVVVKRRNRNVSDAYVVMPLYQFTEVLKELS